MSQLVPKGPSFPTKGKYTLQVPTDLTPEFAFGATKAGNLSVTVDPVIVGPTNEGFQIRYQKLSAKTFPETVGRGSANEQQRMTSQIARFLAACGDYRSLTGDPAQAGQAVIEQAGKTFDALVDWRAYNKRTGEAVSGMENFPKNSYGEPTPWIEDAEDLQPDPKTGEMKPRRYRANLEIVRYLPRKA
jgi:hypothetical protein